MAHQHRSVPLFSVRVRRGHGFGPSIMAGSLNTRSVPPLVLAWPTAEIGRDDGYAAVYDHNASDDVVTPAETRDRIIAVLRHIRRKLDRPAKNHPIDTW